MSEERTCKPIMRRLLTSVQAIGLCMLIAWVLPSTVYAQAAEEPDTASETVSDVASDPIPETVKVGLYESPPFVMPGTDGAPTGMAIDLWGMLAERLETTSDYISYPTIRELTDAVRQGEIDVAVTNLSITHRRANFMHFTQPWYDAGLRVMVHGEGSTGFWSVFEGLASAGHLRVYGWMALAILVGTILLTLFDRKFDKNFHESWRDGIATSFYNVMSVATSGRLPSRSNLFGWIGRIWAGLWLVCGIAVMAYITSSVTSVMTTLAITSTINGPEDLPGKRVGVFSGSVAEEYAQEIGFTVRSFDGMEVAARALANNQIDALVGDAPVLEYYAHVTPAMNLEVVGPIFEPDKYGFALPLDSQLTRRLTVELLALKEEDAIEQLNTQYFGSDW